MNKVLRDQLHSEKENEQSLAPILIPEKARFNRGIKKASFFTILFAICLLALSSSANAQTKIAVSSLKKDASAAEWHLFKQVDGVKISYQYVDCGPVGNIFLKVENTTANNVAVTWKYKYFQEKRELDANPDDVNVAFNLNSKSALTGNCNNSGDGLMVFVKEGNSPFQISEIELSNLTVSQAK